MKITYPYIVLYDNDSLSIQQRSDITNASFGETDKYEELLVNPTLIKLASQRGNTTEFTL